jgi:hypothetical protein
MNKAIVALALATCVSAPALAETNVGVSIGINQPGVYGRIDIGNYPQPAVVYAQPVIIAPSRVATYQRPIYLYVPPGHQKHWAKHCGQYNACGQPVYFVQENWVREHYQRDARDDHHDHDDDRGRGYRGKDKQKHGHGRGHD